MIYDDYKRNHVILPNRENALLDFLESDYDGMKHKWRNRLSSNSEDALTWSCFDVIRQLSFQNKVSALDEIIQDSFDTNPPFCFKNLNLKDEEINIYIGKEYTGQLGEKTEVDASIEFPSGLVFFEAKLYSSISIATSSKPYDQIARKLRVGLDFPLNDERNFYFIFLDIAPLEKINKRASKEKASKDGKGFHNKWKSAWWFSYYKKGRNGSYKPIKSILEGIDTPPIEKITKNMGWLTWSDLFKSVMRGMVKSFVEGE